MSYQSVFPFTPAEWLPIRDQALLDRVWDEDLESKQGANYENPEFEFQIVWDVRNYFATDLFHRIHMSDVKNEKLVLVLPSPENPVYISVVENLNKYRVSCRNVHVFFTAEFANENGDVAPWQSPFSRSSHFMRYFYDRLAEDLRMPMSQIHFWTKENTDTYSNLIEAEGGADVIYTSLTWAGGIGFIDAEAFPAATMEEFLSMGSRRVPVTLETTAMESVRGMFGCSGDLAAVPAYAVTIGPKDLARAKYTVHTQFHTHCGGFSPYQRFPLRLALLGPVDPKNPGSLMRLLPGICYANPTTAAPCVNVPDAMWLQDTLSEIRAKEEK
jgi:hypothetical protein